MNNSKYDDIGLDDIPHYKKKAKHKSGDRANHKHIYEDALIKTVLECPTGPRDTIIKRSVCKVCGLVGHYDYRGWIKEFSMNMQAEWDKNELPHYYSEEYSAKYVTKEEK